MSVFFYGKVKIALVEITGNQIDILLLTKL